jgi:Rha family phage regulatory protein
MNHPFPISTAVSLHNGNPSTTSLEVAAYFGKRHDHVLRDIERLIAPESGLSERFRAPNFGAANYLDDQKKPRPMYRLSFNGFVILVMGYTGPKAMAIKEAYIAEFDRMVKELRQVQSTALRKAHGMLEQRNPDWPVMRNEFRKTDGNGSRIDKRLGYSSGRSSRNVRRMVEWGYMDAQDVAIYQKMHRAFNAALVQVKARQLSLDLHQAR